MKVNSTGNEFFLNQFLIKGSYLNLLIFFCLTGILFLPILTKGESISNLKVATSVNITSPITDRMYAIGETVSIEVDASSNPGNITYVEFFVDGQKVGEDLSSPYQVAWIAVEGRHSLTAIAHDDQGSSATSSSIDIKVRSPKGGSAWLIPGKIEAENYDIGGQGLTYNDLSVGNNGAAFGADDVDIETTADEDGGYTIASIESGEWLEYTVNVTTAASFILSARVAALMEGKTFHVEMDGVNISGAIQVPVTGSLETFLPVTIYTSTLTIGQKTMRIVMDSGDFNLNYVSFAINVPPTAVITSPANGAVYIGPATIIINANAFDADGGITKVEFFNGASLLGEDLTFPYSFTWNNVGGGTYSIKIKATDAFGAITFSTPITISVMLMLPPPEANIISPMNNSEINPGSSLTINATASVVGGIIVRVMFYLVVPGVSNTLLGTDFTSPYSFDWTAVSTPGVYYLRATAVANSGASGTSAGTKITIATPNQIPLVSISSPSNNTSVEKDQNSIVVVDASDPDGTIDHVDFFLNGSILGTDDSWPYNFSWTPTVLGACSLTAMAMDNLGAISTSSILNLTVTETVDPFTIILTSPVNDDSFDEDELVTITVDVFEGLAPIEKVEFFNGTEMIGEDYSFPYSFLWNASFGVHTIKAKAINRAGASVVSPEVFITVRIVDGIVNSSLKTLMLCAHPTPFSSTTIILVDLEQSGETSLIVYNLMGKEVTTLINNYLPGGKHYITFDAAHIPSGMYLIRFINNGREEVLRISKE